MPEVGIDSAKVRSVTDNPQGFSENYHHLTIESTSFDGKTRVALMQNNNFTSKARDHSEKNWKMILDCLKKYVESVNVKTTDADPDNYNSLVIKTLFGSGL
jgi:hypothetical protein